eukprot:4645490-Amphidinium_carterae.1
MKLREAAAEYQRQTGAANVLWDVLCDPIMRMRGVNCNQPEYGSEEHIERSFQTVLAELQKQGGGVSVKLSRWWAWEEQARIISRQRFEVSADFFANVHE